LGQLFEVLEDQVADLPHHPAPLRRRHTTPRAVIEGRSRGSDGSVDVLRPPGGHRRKFLARGRIGRVEGLPRRRVDPLASDQELMRRLRELVDLSVHDNSTHSAAPGGEAPPHTPRGPFDYMVTT
jgi:hypothetical protein